MEFIYVFFTGMLAYPVLEILWRGYTHITMAFAGGIAASAIYYVSTRHSDINIMTAALIGAAVITLTELAFGVLFNMDYAIWDYRERPLNFMGQICVEYTLLWYGLCLIIIPIFKAVHLRAAG